MTERRRLLNERHQTMLRYVRCCCRMEVLRCLIHHLKGTIDLMRLLRLPREEEPEA
jgi:hypothetical protein